MPKFRATVRFTNVSASDSVAVREKLEEQFKKAELPRWRVVDIDRDRNDVQAALPPSRVRGASVPSEINPGLFLLVGAAAWALWFFLMLLDNGA